MITIKGCWAAISVCLLHIVSVTMFNSIPLFWLLFMFIDDDYFILV
ncbi:unnamed protein product [Haemonchus placei]|uniref:Uncharacterized protein n=1 Tax=Haemonchus placei TaxID=6290 RepID=A0A3P8A937_HAEPC|nr:unnamed protein product [Haemonchus placei]